MLELAGNCDEEVISAMSKLQEPSPSARGLAASITDPKCRRWVFEAKRLAIDVRLVSEWEWAKKRGVNALEVGFQQSSIETTVASAIHIAKQMSPCNTRMTSKTDALLDSAFWTLKGAISILGSSLYGAAASKRSTASSRIC